ncbi:glycosyltransferase family 4 protein [Rathayibacter sp. ZW T2_19]|uniref:Glycosyltransferase family 4 protein n=1 Tax=Rathayibacter rubneri TaxID=2950106 RepID=A0A9X2IRQ3_9MICO|nr:glycosyltransferase family 1 protein [Rathayibacter rubneri]MCM6761771.1 glycosyltransferase family 4 protein [Rathayibacter rubneri]
MAEQSTRSQRRAFLQQRLDQLAPFVIEDEHRRAALSGRGPGPLLDAIARETKRRASDDITWLALAAFLAVMPVEHFFLWFRRSLELCEPDEAIRVFLAAGARATTGYADLGSTVEIVTGAVVADVDFCARHAHQTGIQRVVRNTMRRWHGDKDVLPVAWVNGSMAMRRLSPVELERVVDYEVSRSKPWQDGDPDQVSFVVPFRSTVLIPEVPGFNLCAPYASLAAHSGNSVGLIGYDAIPVVSAETVPGIETARFVNYLSIVKHADRVAGISESASAEFEGFVHALPAQGLVGPRISTVALPVDRPNTVDASIAPSVVGPLVLAVGSTEPRKNHLAVLHAAERLWREGKVFTLRFIGNGNDWSTTVFDVRIREAQNRGRTVELWRGASDDKLIASYENARFLVFPSTHEGYGLPVAEALALGVPVITSDHGSLAEIARDGGCVTVDPGDDDALLDAMRELLSSDERIEQLRAEALARPVRTWDDYAQELWDALVPDGQGAARVSAITKEDVDA